MKEKVGLCERCFNLAEGPLCRICSDPNREQSTICVVEEPADVIPIERTHEYRGLYHVLGGALSPIDGVDADDLKIAELVRRTEGGEVTEVVLATNPTTTGEATALHIAELLRGTVTVTRLASGLPVGADLEHADEVTLGKALAGRRSIGAQPAESPGRLSDRKLRVFGLLVSAASAKVCRGSHWRQRDGRRAARGHRGGRLAREVSRLQAQLLGKLGEEIPRRRRGLRRRRPAPGRGLRGVTAAAVDPVAAGRTTRCAAAAAPPPRAAGLPAARKRTRASTSTATCGAGSTSCSRCTAATATRSASPSSTSPGPATRNAATAAPEAALTVVGAALRDSVRLVDEPFRLEEDALCVLAPNQDTVGGVQMSERLLRSWPSWRRPGGLPIEISAGVVACPDHGSEADSLLHNADEAMWRARSVGQPVGVGRCRAERRLARSLTDSRNSSITCVNLAIGWESGEILNSRCPGSEPTQPPKCSASAPTPCAAGSAATASRRRSAPPATTATTSWSSCRRCATPSPRPATSPRRSS